MRGFQALTRAIAFIWNAPVLPDENIRFVWMKWILYLYVSLTIKYIYILKSKQLKFTRKMYDVFVRYDLVYILVSDAETMRE